MKICQKKPSRKKEIKKSERRDSDKRVFCTEKIGQYDRKKRVGLCRISAKFEEISKRLKNTG